MYGLLLLNMSEFVINKFGDNMWKKVKEQLNIEQDFVANESYPEAQLGKMGKTAMKILSLKDEEFYEGRKLQNQGEHSVPKILHY